MGTTPNGSGARGVASRWDEGDLVFLGADGTEALRITKEGAVEINGGDPVATAPFTFPAGVGTSGQVLTSNANGTTSWTTPT